jgi:hypothetical protein
MQAKKIRTPLFNRLKESLEEAQQFTARKLRLKTSNVPKPSSLAARGDLGERN